MGCQCFTSSRELFEAARQAAIDADRCRRQLEAMEHRALSVGRPSLEAHVSGGGDPDRIGRDVAALVDREAELCNRIESDYALIDSACAVLYGSDGTSAGLATLAPPSWSDAIYHRYLGLRTWAEVAAMMGVSVSYAQKMVRAAFDIADANGLAATVAGTGLAEG